jgi:chromosome partitioning protein
MDIRSVFEDGLPDTQWIAICSQKGGVGKTTTCLSLGASLVEQGLRVLLVDLDPQGNLTQALGIDPESLRRTVGDALLMQATLLEVSRETAIFNLDLVPANRGLILAEKMLHNTRSFEFRLKTCLQAMQPSYYDFVLLDCPPSFGPLTINALAAVNLALIPLTCDYYAVQSLQTFLKLIGVLRSRINPELQYRLLVTLFDSRTRLSRLFLDQYRQKYDGLMFDTVIPLDVKLRESPMFGRPVNLYATSARGAQEYRALAGELLSCLEVMI